MSDDQLIIIQATPFCNINCRYCYLPDRTNISQIDTKRFAQIIQRLFASALVKNRITICWHSGEPLVVPISRYEEFHSIVLNCNHDNRDIRQNFQTNGTLIDDKWCEYFKRTDSSIGISIDGPEFLNDMHRVDRSGRGTFRKIMRGINLLRKWAIPINIISVLDYAHLSHADAYYDFLQDIGASSAIFSMQEVEGANQYTTWNHDDATISFTIFLNRILQRNDSSSTPIKFPMLDISLDQDVAPNNTQVRPWEIISIDIDGNVSTFSPELINAKSDYYNSFVVGNLRKQDLEQMEASNQFQRLFADIKTGVENCRKSCQYFEWCGGGAPANKFFENGDLTSTETRYCRNMIQSVLELSLYRDQNFSG